MNVALQFFKSNALTLGESVQIPHSHLTPKAPSPPGPWSPLSPVHTLCSQLGSTQFASFPHRAVSTPGSVLDTHGVEWPPSKPQSTKPMAMSLSCFGMFCSGSDPTSIYLTAFFLWANYVPGTVRDSGGGQQARQVKSPPFVAFPSSRNHPHSFSPGLSSK